jgi:hypothetical protein
MDGNGLAVVTENRAGETGSEKGNPPEVCKSGWFDVL